MREGAANDDGFKKSVKFLCAHACCITDAVGGSARGRGCKGYRNVSARDAHVYARNAAHDANYAL